MAAGDLLAKRQGAFGIAAQTDAATVSGTAPAHWLTCDSANIEFTPNVYERVNNITQNKIGIEQAGNDYAFSFSNAEVSIDQLGYLLWLFLGGESFATSTHTMDEQYDSKYFTVFKDHGAPFDGTNNVERLVGCRFDSLSIDQQRAGYAKISGSGFGLSLSPDNTAHNPSVSLGAADAPLSWASLQAGSFQLGFNGAAKAAVTAPTSLKIDFSREIDRHGADIDGNDPSEIVEGGRAASFELDMDFIEGNTEVEALIAAAKSAHDVELQATWITGGNILVLGIPVGRITGTPAGEIGSGTETQSFNLSAEAFDDGLGDITAITATVAGSSAYS